MACQTAKSTVLKLAAVVALLLLGGYALFPAFRSLLAGVAPLLLSLACPLSMLLCLRHRPQPAAAAAPRDHG